MTFVSLTFLLFLSVVFTLYWVARRRLYQNALLVAASYFFYGWWDYRFCALMLASSLVDFGIGAALAKVDSQSGRRRLLWMSIFANLGLLGIFKYFNFFTENFSLLAAEFGWKLNTGTLEIILPVGISFYTFQTLSYTIDVYRRRLEPTHNIVDYLAFVSFFPQLVAGPIERATNLLPQFARTRHFHDVQAAAGCRQILWGFFKKLVIADRLALFVDAVYGAPATMEGPTLALATVCFAFQIYCDFSAYSDIAIGTSKLFGLELMRNFNYPYFSQSIAEFWRRWHISLSTWFRDYVFIPLGGSQASSARRALNVMVTFLVSGLWHGAAWRFLVWGGINGAAVVASSNPSRVTARDVPGGERLFPHPITLLKMSVTFTIVCAAWVFFRADTVGDAVMLLQKICTDLFSNSGYLAIATQIDTDKVLRKTIVLLGLFLVVEWLQRRKECPLQMTGWPLPVRWATYTLVIWATLDLMPRAGAQQFIYFEF